jgi:hypothetical protein
VQCKMQDREEEGCWNITIGYVFIQEPDESSPTCTSQESQFKCDYVDCRMGRGRGGEGGGCGGGGGDAERDIKDYEETGLLHA